MDRSRPDSPLVVWPKYEVLKPVSQIALTLKFPFNRHYQVKRLPYNINDHEFADALVAAFLELHHASGTSQQRDAPPSQSPHIQTIKPKLVRSPSDYSRAKPGLLSFDITAQYLNDAMIASFGLSSSFYVAISLMKA